MTDYIKNQLKRVSYANLNNFDEATNTFHIPKYTKPKYDAGHCYLIKVARELINNTTNTLASNWNGGRAPQHEYYKAYVSNIAGTMLKVDCLAVDMILQKDLDIMWSGYLPIDYIEQISKLS